MTIEQNKNGSELTIRPVGRLDSVTSGDLYDCLEQNFTPEISNLVLDFSKVDFISSKGLRVLVSVCKNLGDRKMKVINANESVADIFRLSGLLKIFEGK